MVDKQNTLLSLITHIIRYYFENISVLHHFYLILTDVCNFYHLNFLVFTFEGIMPLTKLIFMNIIFDACIKSDQLFLQPTFSNIPPPGAAQAW